MANATAESDRVQIWTSGTCCRGLPAMEPVDLRDPKDGGYTVTAPLKLADYYVVLLGTPQEPDGSPHIIAQSGEFHVMSCLPGEQGCAPAGTDTRWFYDTDAIGSVRLITDDSGGTFARYDYAPFGEPTLVEDPDNPRRFAGKEFDAESRLNYFGARYFVAELGRFAAADPGQADGDPLHPQSWNAYAYSRNNPFRFVDPLGTCSQDAAGNYTDSDNESSAFVYAGKCLLDAGALASGLTDNVALHLSSFDQLLLQTGSTADAGVEGSLIILGATIAVGASGGAAIVSAGGTASAYGLVATKLATFGAALYEGSILLKAKFPGAFERVHDFVMGFAPSGPSATWPGLAGAVTSVWYENQKEKGR